MIDTIFALMQAQQKVAGTDDGIWRFPNGAERYQALLKFYTTTDLTPDQIQDLGLAQVARIHGEMTALKDQTGFKGSLQDFFKFMREDKRFYYPNNAAGKQMYLDESLKAQQAVQAALAKAQQLAHAAIERARQAAVALVRAAGAALTAIATVALAAFPRLREAAVGFIQSRVRAAEAAINALAASGIA